MHFNENYYIKEAIKMKINAMSDMSKEKCFPFHLTLIYYRHFLQWALS